jgi:hypothetical protein
MVSVQIGIVAQRDNLGDFIEPEPIYASIDGKDEFTEMEKKPLRQLGRWIFKRYKESEQAKADNTAWNKPPL